METVGVRELNRWTLARQHLLTRAAMDPVDMVSALAGMQAQHPPSPYVGLWSRLARFEPDDLTEALYRDDILKATLMRGTLHLVARRDLGALRALAGSSYYDTVRRRLVELGADVDALRAHVASAVAVRARTRVEVARLIAEALPVDPPDWVLERSAGVSAVSVCTDLVNLPQDAELGWSGGSRYRLAPPHEQWSAEEAMSRAVGAYLAAFGPASRADLAQWSGRGAGSLKTVLDAMDLVVFQGEDARLLYDLPDAPRPSPDVEAPVRLLPRWDNLLLAYTRRERVLPEPYRKAVVAPNGDVAATFLVDGMVAGTWEWSTRGPAVATLRALAPRALRRRDDIEAEALGLLQWLRRDAGHHELRWA